MSLVVEAVADLLQTKPELILLFSGRVYPVSFEQAKLFPALTWNTRNDENAIECRGGSTTKYRILELVVMADLTLDLETATEKLINTLKDYEGTHLGWFLQLSNPVDDFNETATQLDSLYKRLEFNLEATKIN